MEDFVNDGVKDQELAAPENVTTDLSESESTELSENNQDVAEPESGKTEEDSRFAAVRRAAEESARKKYEARLSAQDERIRQVFGNVVNPATGKPVQTVDEYTSVMQQSQRVAVENQMKEKGIDPSLINQMIRNSPEMVQAQQILAQNQMAEADRRIKDDLKIVSAIDPSIQTAEDLAAHESYDTVVRYVQRGLSLADAFKLANYDRLTGQRAEAAKQAAINAAKSTSHLQTTPAGNGGSDNMIDIPSDEIATWREYYPGLSDGELKKKYNQIL